MIEFPQVPVTRRTAIRAGTGAVAGFVLAGAIAEPANALVPGPVAPPYHVTLSPRQQAGQRVIFSYPGATVPESLLQRIHDGEVGGVIFFGENITSLDQIAGVVGDLNRAQAAGPVDAPLLLMTDQEGGFIRRLRGQEPVLSEKDIGLSADPLAAATAAGTGAGNALLGVGMNVNLAPVQDVYREEGNFDDRFERSYGMDPVQDSKLGAAFVTAQQNTGVAATAKHFPGLGAAASQQNTDLGVVVLTQSAEEIRSIDEAAFRGPIEAGVDLVMFSWAEYPAIDPGTPAGISRTFVVDELRNRLHFRGVTITDALEAGALGSLSTAQRAVMAAQAGVDLLLCSARDLSQGAETVDAITDALDSKELDPGHFKNSLRRTMTLRNSLA